MTYHDSCNLARNGGLIEEPRYVLNRITTDFREMTLNRAEAICYGGGGGLVALAEYADRRITPANRKQTRSKRPATASSWQPVKTVVCRLAI